MKRSIVIAVLAMAALVSCQQGTEMEVNTPNKGEVAFYLSGAKATKASGVNATVSGTKISLGSDEYGNDVYLQESITYLDALPVSAPETKGTPVYTSNFGSISNGQFNATVVRASDDVEVHTNDTFTYDSSKKLYVKEYGDNFWKDAPLYVYMWMPGTMSGVDNLGFDDGKISFTYDQSVDTTAAVQQDLLFTSRYFTDKLGTANDFNSYNEETGAAVLFHHALTGVKFSTANHISNETTGTKTYITKVRFKGLAYGGDCVITPVGSEANPTSPYTLDNITNYSSADCVVWDPESLDYDDDVVFSQTFTAANYKSNIYDSHYNYETEGAANDGYFPDSFYGTDAAWSGSGTHRTTDWNMNDANATLTFWFIPQQLHENVELEVTFHIEYHTYNANSPQNRVGKDITRTIKFGDLTRKKNNDGSYGEYPTWNAGELRTYVLKAQEVDVEITDDLSNNKKDNLQITNTGNVPQYVRTTLIAYWANEDGDAVFGYDKNSVTATTEDGVTTYTLKANPTYVEPWTLEKEKSSSTALYGTMSTFYPDVQANNWALGKDGYYYYKGVLGVDESSTKVMFESYELDTNSIPEIYQIDQKTLLLTKVPVVKLIMEVACQAVIAKESSTSSTGYVPWNEAWEAAIGYDPSN